METWGLPRVDGLFVLDEDLGFTWSRRRSGNLHGVDGGLEDIYIYTLIR